MKFTQIFLPKKHFFWPDYKMWPEYKISSRVHPLQQVLLKCWTCNWCLWNPVPHKLFWKCWPLNSMPSSVTLDTVYILQHTKISQNRKRRKQHVFILLNKILGAELYRVINNIVVSAGMMWAQEISLINQCAMNWPWLNWCLFENTKRLWVDSEFLVWCRSQKERWKVKNVSCILSRALSLEWWTPFSDHIPELVWCVIWEAMPPNVMYSYPSQGQCCRKDMLLFILQVHWRRWHSGRPWSSREKGDFSYDHGLLYLNTICFSDPSLGRNKGCF